MILTYLVPVLFTFYIQGVLKFKKYNSGAKRLTELQAYRDAFISNKKTLDDGELSASFSVPIISPEGAHGTASGRFG